MGTTRNGERCRIYTRHPSGLCPHHRDQESIGLTIVPPEGFGEENDFFESDLIIDMYEEELKAWADREKPLDRRDDMFFMWYSMR